MKNKLLSNLSYAFCTVLGFLNFILLAFPYAASFYSYDLGAWGGKGTESVAISGYEVMKLWDGGFGGVMSALTQILLLLFGIAMMAYGAYGLLRGMDILQEELIPENLCSKTYAKYALYGYTALNVLLLIFLIILCATNTQSESEYGYAVKAGIRLGAGIFITLIMGAGAIVAEYLLRIKLALTDEATFRPRYLCSQCGKQVKKGVKFCPECGGKVEEQSTSPTSQAEETAAAPTHNEH